MDIESISAALVRQWGFAVFEYLGHGAFRLLGEPASFWNTLPAAGRLTDAGIHLIEEFPFLEHFQKAAEKIWAAPSESLAESGTWIERNSGGRELALEATALWLAGIPALAIQNPQAQYEHSVHLQQKARDSMLAREQLTREIQAKEILLHCIVHDLFQPLTVMRGSFTLLLAKEILPPDLKRLVKTAEVESERQEQMIRGILDAFAAELAAQKVMEDDPAKAPDLARCEVLVVETFKSAFADKQVRLKLHAEVDLDQSWRVRGDEPHLVRIFGNLLENALRHSPPGSNVHVGFVDEGPVLLAFVDDEGPGLPQDMDPDRLFALFARGKEKRGGKAGLGLYFCKITVERWGGAIGCRSRPSGGARFWFRLPRVK